MADTMEASQIEVAKAMLASAQSALTDPLSTRAEIEYAGIRLVECLTEVVRVAESRGQRLTKVDSDASEETPPPEE
ncbi:hypothetical protein OG746_29270 [Streptomyces sp. NBC_01016]|uniref:hypothetical protein n=1 Tax=Streptomyces sp. NBC_01016 TaxID=2903720 RepID=UPI00225B730E|nr:hypothetical protein [Streptomyces sp. NBC_01016]MCX4832829.1 hypothetical protein [Streptomyces sp. NBC_01016]